MRILLAVEPTDFRKGIDGLAQVCRHVLRKDPFSGYVFIFRNKKANAIKVLMYDGQGFWLCQKRLSKGRFNGWPANGNRCLRQLAVHELQLLIWNGDLGKARVAPVWRPLQLPGEKSAKN
jgi:transposase